jgi:hypothetical protein
MRVGVYVDGYNLYYGARSMCGRGTSGWRWLDLRGLAESLIADQSPWSGVTVETVTYCTARISGTSPAEHVSVHEQDVYLRALARTGSVTRIEYGNYVARVATAPLARRNAKGRPVLVNPDWPIMVRDAAGADVPDGLFMASVARREEKGTDVNVASHLLIDVLTGAIDAAVVISNDSDLAYPITFARTRVPVGTVNPTKGFTAGKLEGAPGDGVGGHWWYQLQASDLTSHQLPAQVGARIAKPAPW